MEQSIENIAEAAHEVNRAFCFAIGDYSQLPWKDAPDWQRKSAVEGVISHMDTELTPKQSHEAWLEHKCQEGWVYGAEKDPELKHHPCMVPYSELPPEQQAKDALFSTVVAALS